MSGKYLVVSIPLVALVAKATAGKENQTKHDDDFYVSILSLPDVWLDVVRIADRPECLCRRGVGSALCSTTDQSARRIVRSSCKSWKRNLSAVEESSCKRSAMITSDMTDQFPGGQLR
ncbi:uncharacterized protein LOC144135045 isoform X2 [Amblyomma americanum]